MIFLSVIVAIYNGQDYLHGCLSSIREALKDGPAEKAEVLCVSDGSTDNSAEIVRAIAANDSRFRLIEQVNGGYGKAVNRGMAEARGRYIAIVENDDLLLPGGYSPLLELLEADPRVDFVKSPYQPFTAAGPEPIILMPPSGQSTTDILALIRDEGLNAVTPSDFTSDDVVLGPPSIWSAVYRQTALRSRGIVLPETPGAGYQDTSFSAMCLLNGLRYHWVSDRFYMYRIDRATASRHARNRRDEMIDLFRFVRMNLSKNGTLTDISRPYFFAVYMRRLLWFFQRVRSDYYFQVFLAAYREFDEVWRDDTLRVKVRALLPEGEAERFDAFFNGQHAILTGKL